MFLCARVIVCGLRNSENSFSDLDPPLKIGSIPENYQRWAFSLAQSEAGGMSWMWLAAS